MAKKFGKFLSGKGAIFNDVPASDEESLQHGNALAHGVNSNYPVGTSPCFNVGISGGCGPECFEYQRGGCEVAEEMVDAIKDNKYPDFTLEEHYQIYDKRGVAL